jgi:hypothetical protein
MGVNVVPPTAVNLADNPKNRLYRATQSGTYSVSIPVGVYEVTRQATTNIIIGSTTLVPSTAISLLFVNEQQSSITFNSTVSSSTLPWVTGTNFNNNSYSIGDLHRVKYFSALSTFFGSSSGTNNLKFLSTNGLVWQQSGLFNGQGADKPIGDVSTAPGTLYPFFGGLTNQANSSNNWFHYSTDLRNWVSRMVYNPGTSNIFANNYVASAYGAGRFLLAGAHQGTTAIVVTTTEDLISVGGDYGRWNDYYLSSNEVFNTAIFADGKFVLGGSAGSIFTSTNGTTWTFRGSGFIPQAINRIIYGDGKFLAAGNSGMVRVSTDGITWEARNPGYANNVNITNATYSAAEGVWVVGNRDDLRISTDTVTWSTRALAATVTTYGLAAGPNGYVAAQYLDNTTFRAYSVTSMITQVPSVPFVDTYIILEYKGKTKVLS